LFHDLHHLVRDVFSNNGQHTQFLYTNLPPHIEDYINNTHFNFNANIEDVFIWSNNKNGAYSTKSGYTWLLSLTSSQDDDGIQAIWSWIWKIKAPEKYKFLIWLACHDAAPTLYLLHLRRIAGSAICTRCGDHEETSFIVSVITDIQRTFGSKLNFLVMIFFLLLASLIGSVMVLIPLTILCSLLLFGGVGEIGI